MTIVVIMGKSGCGKSTIEKMLQNVGYTRIISYTTRDIRDNEENHIDYHFVTEEQFDSLIESGIFMEHATYGGKRYGAPKPVGAEKYVIVTEMEGFQTIKGLYGRQAIGIYLDVGQEEIERRLNIRNNTPSEVRKSRIEVDKEKFKDIKKIADYSVNGDRPVLEVFNDVLSIIRDRRLDRK